MYNIVVSTRVNGIQVVGISYESQPHGEIPMPREWKSAADEKSVTTETTDGKEVRVFGHVSPEPESSRLLFISCWSWFCYFHPV